MYHELTTKQIARRRRNRIIGVIVIVLIVIACVFAYNAIAANMRDQGAASVHDAIESAAKQCAAIEGSYPVSLKYLEDNYGLRVNHDDYVITYEIFAGNVIPSILVVPR